MPKPSEFSSTAAPGTDENGDPTGILGTEWVIIEKGGTTYKVALSRIKTYYAASVALPDNFPADLPATPDFRFVADFAVLRYEFTDGRDLDIHATLKSPYQSAGIGWNRSGGDTYLTWSGDNTGLGFESVLIDLAGLRAAYPNDPGLHFNCKGWWYDQYGPSGARLGCAFFRGGSPVKNAYLWDNNLPIATAQEIADNDGEPPAGKCAKLDHATDWANVPAGGANSTHPGFEIADFYYNQDNGNGYFVTP
jgi:hypothetical protein